MVGRLYDGMRRADPPGRAKGPGEGVSRVQFTVSLSHLLKGSSEEKSLMVLRMISAAEGPVKAREVSKVEAGPWPPSQAGSASPGGALGWQAAGGGMVESPPSGGPGPHSWLGSEPPGKRPWQNRTRQGYH